MQDRYKKISVCSECLQSSCVQGIFYCDKAKNADIIELPVWALEKLNLEHPDYWE